MLIAPHTQLKLSIDSPLALPLQLLQLRRSCRGFTLIEIMIVVLVIGILVAVAIPTFGVYRDKASVSAALSTGNAIKAALAAYATSSENNLYPATITDYNELISIVNPNGAQLKASEIQMGVAFRSYSPIDLSGDGERDSYTMSFDVVDVDPRIVGWCIVVTPAGIEKCAGL